MRSFLFLLFSAALSISLWANGTLTVSTPGYVENRNADYTTSHVYIDEVAGTSVPITFRYEPGMANIDKVQLWTNVNRRDLANIDKNNDGYPDGVVPPDGSTITDSAEGTDPVTGHYYIPLNMQSMGNGIWELTVPMTKTGAYRVNARFSTMDQPGTWHWYGAGGNRDHAVVVAPTTARDIRLYEINVFNINASGDTFETRSTLETLHDSSQKWNLNYLQGLGMNWLWFQPIHPNGIDGREIDSDTDAPYQPGSPYAVKNFFEVNELMSSAYDGGKTTTENRAASMQAWQDFVAAADAKEVGIMLDAPFNHTAFDVELADIGVQLFQPDGQTWSATDEIRNREARFFSREGNYMERASSAGNIAPAPDRFDFGKWFDVKDVFFGRYAALVQDELHKDDYKNEGDWFDSSQTEWNADDFLQNGKNRNVTRLVWQYFAHYAVHWLEKTRPAGQNRNSTPADGDAATRYAWDAAGIDGLRCDFGQGLPPQCWEYIINTARSYKWNFVMMTESLDGAEVTYRSARHFELLNESIVFSLNSASTNQDIRNIYEDRRNAYGQALVLSNTTSHDESVAEDPWQAVVKFLATSTIDGVPMIFPGQELGISDDWGYSQYELNFGKQIPHFKRWNSMMPVWNDSDFGNIQLYKVYAAAAHARATHPALRSSNRWFLTGDGNNNKIHAVAKYETEGISPAVSDVVIAFSNLDRDNAQADNFKIPSALADRLGLKSARSYNVRNAAAYENPEIGLSGRDQDLLWGNGYSGDDLVTNGVYVSLNAVPTSNETWETAPFEAQYLKLYDVTAPTSTPSTPEIDNPYAYAIGDRAEFHWTALPADSEGVVPAYEVIVTINGSPAYSEITENPFYEVVASEGDEVSIELRAVNPHDTRQAALTSATGETVKLLSPTADEDGDGQNNLEESIAGTDPFDVESVFKIHSIERSEGALALSFSSVAGKTYQLEASNDLETWEPLGAAVEADAAQTVLDDIIDTGDATRRFFRMRISQTP